MAGLQRTKTSAKPVAVKTDPPKIFYSKRQAIMLLVDGEPVRAPIEKTEIEFMVNTNWDLFYDKKGKTIISWSTRPGCPPRPWRDRGR